MLYGHQIEKPCLHGFANNKGADQPARPRSLISDLVIRFLDSIISELATKEIFIFLASLCSWWDWFESYLVGNPVYRFSCNVAHNKSWFFSLFRVKENELRVKRIQENLAKKPVRTRVRKAGGLVSFFTVLGADPGFLEWRFICIRVWGFALLILSHFHKYPMKMT